MNRNSARVDNATLAARIGEVQKLCQDEYQQVLEVFEKQKLDYNTQFEKQTEQLNAMQIELGTTEQNGRTLLSMARDAVQGILEVKDLLISMSQAVISLQISATQTQYMRPLDPTKELSVTLEDSLGRQIPIPAEWLDTLEWAVCANFPLILHTFFSDCYYVDFEFFTHRPLSREERPGHGPASSIRTRGECIWQRYQL